MTSINPLLYITEWEPVAVNALKAANWFENEYATVKIYEGSGDSIGWFLAQGWTVLSVTAGQVQLNSNSFIDSSGKIIRPEPTLVVVYTYQLLRRKLQSERVLQAMIEEFTKAYNEGRSLNDERYDNIVKIMSVMLDDSQNELININTTMAPYETIVDGVIAALPSDFTTYQTEVEGIYDEWGTAQRERVNTQFDNQLEQAKADLITRGMYNTTVWTSSASSIEESRAKALNELEDRIVDKRFAVSDKINSVRSEMRSKLEASALRLAENKRTRMIGQLEFRNAIIKELSAFMERRSDDYPGIGELAKLAAGLGYSEGSSVRAS